MVEVEEEMEEEVEEEVKEMEEEVEEEVKKMDEEVEEEEKKKGHRPSSDLMVVCASCTTANSWSSTPYEACT